MLKKVNSIVNIFFRHMDKTIPVKAVLGSTLLDTAHKNKINLEGACEGNLACSTCHVILDKKVFDASHISDRENDLLDLAYGLSPTSRLACQVPITKSMENTTILIPRCTRNLAVDGYKPPIH